MTTEHPSGIHYCVECRSVFKSEQDYNLHPCRPVDEPELSVVPDTVEEPDLDELVSRASVPNLASMFRQAKASGLIGPVTMYGEHAPAR